MHLEAFGKIDKWLGKPGCLLCTLLRRVTDLLPSRKSENEKPKRLLFLKLTEMGATVLARSALERAAAMVGRDHVYFLTLEENRPILDILQLVPPKNILTIRRDSLVTFAVDGARRLWDICRLKVDVTVDLEFFMRATPMIAYLSGARIRVGLHRFNWEGPYRGDLLTHKLQYNPHLHTAQLYDAEVRAIEETPGTCPLGQFEVSRDALIPPRFEAAPKERAALSETLQQIAGGRRGSPLILLNPNCGDILPMRKWPPGYYVELGKALLGHYPEASIFCIALESDGDAVAAICNGIDPARAFSLAGKTTFRELLTLYTLADVFVSADCGPAHFASLTEVSSVVLFGIETPKLFGPLGDHVHVIAADCVCSPCVNPLNQRISPCNDNHCMRSITPDKVLSVVRECLENRSKQNLSQRND